MRRDQNGFTLIELLVVILIIGILAAIAIPAFLGQRARGHDTAAKTFVRHVQTTIETHYAADQTYTGATAAVLRTLEPSLVNANGITLSNPTSLSDEGYVLRVTSKTLNTFTITRVATGATRGRIIRTCTRTGTTKGGCKLSGTW